jgi:4-hydroxy-L-threonine phosphate dehydrogenase PdxA
MTARGKIDRRPYLGFTMGDPAGIGPEVLAKALARPEVSRLCRPLVIGSPAVMEQTVKALRLPLRIVEVPSYGHEATLGRKREVPVLDPLERPLRKFAVGKVSSVAGAASVAYIKMAVKLAQADCIDAVVTGPINKEAMNKAGFDYPGHTELLAELTGSEEVGMMILGGPLKIMFVTTHVADGGSDRTGHPAGRPGSTRVLRREAS